MSKQFITRKGFISKSGSTVESFLNVSGNTTSPAFVTIGGLVTDFVKGDGTLDSSSYSLTGHTHDISDITGFTDNSTNWDSAYNDTITGMTVTGTTTKTISLFQRDGDLIQANFTDEVGAGGTDDFTTGATFNTSTGILEFTRQSGATYNVNLDDRYSLTGHTHTLSGLTDTELSAVTNNTSLVYNSGTTKWEAHAIDLQDVLDVYGYALSNDSTTSVNLDITDGGGFVSWVIGDGTDQTTFDQGTSDILFTNTQGDGTGAQLAVQANSARFLRYDATGSTQFNLGTMLTNVDFWLNTPSGATNNSDYTIPITVNGVTANTGADIVLLASDIGASSTGHTHTLSALTDTELSAVTNNTSLVYNSGTTKWEAHAIDLQDVLTAGGTATSPDGLSYYTMPNANADVGRYMDFYFENAASENANLNLDYNQFQTSIQTDANNFTQITQNGGVLQLKTTTANFNQVFKIGDANGFNNTYTLPSPLSASSYIMPITVDGISANTVGNIDLSSLYSLTGHTHDGLSDDFVTGATFNTSDGVLEFTRQSGSTFNVDLDDRYSLTGHTHTLTGLTDTELSATTDGKILTYQASTQKWIASGATGGSGSGITWGAVTGNTTCSFETGYIANSASLITFTLPTTNAIKTIRITGKGNGGWQIDVPNSWTIYFAGQSVTDNLQSNDPSDSLELLGLGDDEYQVISSIGNITFNNL